MQKALKTLKFSMLFDIQPIFMDFSLFFI